MRPRYSSKSNCIFCNPACFRGVCFTYTRRTVPTDEFGESYLLTIGLILKNQEAKQDVLSKLDSELYLIIMDLVMTFFHSVVRAYE